MPTEVSNSADVGRIQAAPPEFGEDARQFNRYRLNSGGDDCFWGTGEEGPPKTSTCYRFSLAKISKKCYAATMNLKLKKTIASWLIFSVPAAAALCEANCAEVCEEVKYVALHPLESTGPVQATAASYVVALATTTSTVSNWG